MRIDTEIKLDFKDVLIRPKRSTLSSRSQVNLTIDRKMKHSGQVWNGVPCIAANMDTVGTFEIASVLAEHKIITAVHKHYTTEQWKEFMTGKGKDAQHKFINTHVSVLAPWSHGYPELVNTVNTQCQRSQLQTRSH